MALRGPQSLLGQVMLVLALGLLIGQAVAAVLLYQAAEQRREANLVASIAFRLIAESDAPGDPGVPGTRRAQLRALREARPARGLGDPGDRPFRRGPRIGLQRSASLPIAPEEPRLNRFETALAGLLEQQSVTTGRIVITRRRAADDPYFQARAQDRPRLRAPEFQVRTLLVAAIERADRTGWLVVRLPEPEAPTQVIVTIVVQTLVIFAVLVLLLYLVLRRITRPLAQLTARMSDFSRQPDRVVMIAESGPADMRRLIAAHNAMEARIAALLDEKDVMLGAIGHDLKTPLAALRVRIESVPDPRQRERMAASIEDITRTLDDILSLARVGRSGTEAEAVDLGALMLAVVEEFEDLGEAVALAENPRVVARVQETWLKRALRNLVANAVRYGARAEVALIAQDGMAVLRVEDHGPGIPADQIAAMLEPFTRGEASRNRATGGAGLGLTLARAIAEAHGGALVLENRAEGGLRAEIRVPLG
jgi:signal transduction histidine kinase